MDGGKIKKGESNRKMLSKEILDNNIVCFQESGLYHFTSDALILSRFTKPKKNERVADFCSGSGIVGLNFYALNKGYVKNIALFEMQKALYDLSLLSVKENGIEDIFTAYNVKIQELPKEFNGYFSLILCNPPYFKANKEETTAENIAVCKSEITLTLEELLMSAAKNLKFGGRFCFVHQASRLAEIIFTLKKFNLEPKVLQFVSSGAEIYLVIIEAVKGGKTGLKIKETVKN